MSGTSEIVGRGWAFPPDFDDRSGTVAMVDGEQDIRQSLRLIFETRVGERPMEPMFGSLLADHVFDSPGFSSPDVVEAGQDGVDKNQLGFLKNRIKTAILLHEPRIDAEDPLIEMDLEGRLQISVEYTIRGTNSRFNFVHPFYLREDGA